jgi:hypothetical protein
MLFVVDEKLGESGELKTGGKGCQSKKREEVASKLYESKEIGMMSPLLHNNGGK